MFLREFIARTRFSARGASQAILLASAILALSAWAAAWGIESIVGGSDTRSRRDDVRAALVAGRSLLSDRAAVAASRASQLASSQRVQVAYAQRDEAALQRIAAAQPNASFVLWNGTTVGSSASLEPQATIGVFSSAGRIGEVVVAAPPSSQAFASISRRAHGAGLVYVVGGRAVAASPPLHRTDLATILSSTINDEVDVAGDTVRPASLYAYASKPQVPGAPVWPVLVAVLVGLGSYSTFVRRDARRRAEPLPNQVRDAVALVGETLAATHNPRALVPVILRASVEATGAAGGTVEQDGVVFASRGVTPRGPSESIDLTLDVGEESLAVMRLYPPASGFRDDAREAATWIGSQALIALENARLHGLVQRQAVTDDLTGLANRRRFLSALEREIGRSRRSGSPLAVVLADLDHFKKVNDTWGHDVGDEALRTFAATLRATVRDIDLPVRLGGEEFAVLLPDTDLEGASQLADRVRAAVEAAVIRTAEANVRVTASFGVASFPATSAETLLSNADRRLYEAKRLGKNRVMPPSQPHANVG